MPSRLKTVVDKVKRADVFDSARPEALAMLAGMSTGLGSGRAFAGHTAASIAPHGRKTRSEDIARRVAYVGAPLGSVGALILAKKKGLTPLMQLRHMNKFPRGLLADPAVEQALLRYLVPMGVGAAGGVAGGVATGGLIGGIQKLRGSPYGQDKEASIGGQDLRSPMMGSPKFPTGDSLRPAKSKLQQSTAEVGPQPAELQSGMAANPVGKPKWAASTKAAPYQQSRKGKRPIRVHNLVKKAGDVMDPMLTDPLVLYLKKEAAKDSAKEQIPLTDLVDGMGVLRDNLSDLPLGKEEHELSSLPPQPTKDMTGRIEPDIYGYSDGMFDNSHTTRRKYTDKDHSFEGFDSGVVDRILGL